MKNIGDLINKERWHLPSPDSSKKDSLIVSPKKEPFIPFPRLLTEDYRNRLITYRELELHNWMRLHANLYGIAAINVHALLDDLPHFKSVDRITKVLRELLRKRYIYYAVRKGHRGTFEVRFDHWLGKGGQVQRLDRFFLPKEVRGDSQSKVVSGVEPTPSLDTHSPRLSNQETQMDTRENELTDYQDVGGDKNDKENNKEKETNDLSNLYKGEENQKKVATRYFEATNDSLRRCKEIAEEIGDTHMNFILSVLRNEEYGGLQVLEDGLLQLRQAKRKYASEGKDVRSSAALFNACVKSVMEDKKHKKTHRSAMQLKYGHL